MLHAKFSNMACGKFKFTNYTNFVYFPWRGYWFGGGSISISYSMQTLQYVIEKQAIKSYKSSQKLLTMWC